MAESHPSNEALAEGIRHVTTQAAGVMEVLVVRPPDGPSLLVRVAAGDPEAARLLRAITMAQRQITSAPKKFPMLCASCPRPLVGNAYSFAVAMPACDSPTQAIGLAVCRVCATTAADVGAKAVTALRSIWPDARTIEIGPGGTA